MIVRKIIPAIGLLDKYKEIMAQTEPIRSLGKVMEVSANVVYSIGPEVALGEICHIEKVEDESYISAEVIGFKNEKVILSPLENITGIYPGCKVLSTGSQLRIPLSDDLLGRVLDGMGNPLDEQGKIVSEETSSLMNEPPNPLTRPIISKKLETGIRAIDSFLTLGKGQRIGIFSGSGVGKSTLLGMLARNSKADINVIGLIGERGREVAEFIQNELGEYGMAKSVVVVATSNESAQNRVRAAYLTTTIAEYFREKGKDVLLLMDSLTRLSMAQREVGMAANELPATKGYPPSVFSMMPKLLERAGNSKNGSITGVYTVLIEADDMNDPIGDAARGILDGHIILSRDLAVQGHFPAIDVVESLSRSMPSVIDEKHYNLAMQLRELMAVYKENEEQINIGAYVKGANQKLDLAISYHDEIVNFLKQKVDEFSSTQETIDRLEAILHPVRGLASTSAFAGGLSGGVGKPAGAGNSLLQRAV